MKTSTKTIPTHTIKYAYMEMLDVILIELKRTGCQWCD